ncbi:hypothetical protein Tco_1516254 [Tanacetum coccineum]
MGACKTHHLLLDHSFEDFSIKCVGGLHLLIIFGDHTTMVNALANVDLVASFKSMPTWNPLFRPAKRLVWLAIVGLPPQLWFPLPFTLVAEHFGNVLILEDCSPKKFNMSQGKDKDSGHEDAFSKNFHVGDNIVDDSNFNVADTTSFRAGSTSQVGREVNDNATFPFPGSDFASFPSRVQPTPSHQTSLIKTHQPNITYPSNSHYQKSPSGSPIHTKHSSSPLNTLKPATKNTSRKKRYSSLRLIDSMNRVNIPKRNSKKTKNNTGQLVAYSQSIAPTCNSHSEGNDSFLDSLANIRRCNL